MKLFGKKNETAEDGGSLIKLKSNVKKIANLLNRFETLILILAVGSILAVTAMRTLKYMDAPIDDQYALDSISKLKSIRIDQTKVTRIKSLVDSQTTVGSSVQDNRNNPFSE